MTTFSDSAGRPATPAQLAWLGRELRVWEAGGLLQQGQADAILRNYRAAHRISLGRLLLTLGAGFVGVGLVWLVAANLDQFSPPVRFGIVAALWLALLLTAEVLHDREVSRPVVGAARLLAVLGFAATVFQAAQSLQVPAFEPSLLGVVALGALVHAYAVHALGPLVLGTLTGATWYVVQLLWVEPSALVGVLALGSGAVIALSFGAVQERTHTSLSAPWRETGALLALVALFVSALPFVDTADFVWSRWLVGGLIFASVTAIAALALAQGSSRLEPLGGVVVLGISVCLVLWEAGSDSSEPLTAVDWAHAGVGVAAYVALAVAIAVLGLVEDSWRLTALSTVGLVAFTTFQSFAVFARIIQGAWLFVVLGLIFLATGFLFDRARRGLAASFEEEES